MIDIKGNIEINSAFFEGFEVVRDLIYYDGPILSHLKSSYGKDYLFYWIDFNEEVNKWLVAEVSENILYDFLTHRISLTNIFQGLSNNLFISEINESGESVKSFLIPDFKLIPDNYLPAKPLMWQYDLPKEYKYLSEKYSETFELQSIREHSISIKLKPIRLELYVNECIDIFRNISESLTSYLVLDFQTKFRDNLEENIYNDTLKKIKEYLRFVFSDLKYASFEASIGVQYFTIKNEKYFNWGKELISSYKNEVWDLDYSSSEAMQNVVDNKSLDFRRKVIEPIITVLNNKTVTINIKSYGVGDYTIVRRPTKETINIFKSSFIEQETLKQKDEIVYLDTVAQAKRKKDGTFQLMAKNTDMYSAIYDEEIRPEYIKTISTSDGTEFKFKNQLKILFEKNGSLYEAHNTDLNIKSKGDNRSQAILRIEQIISDLIESCYFKEDVDLSPEFLIIKYKLYDILEMDIN